MGLDNAEDKIRSAIINLQKPQPFFSQLLMYMNPKQLPEHYPMQTMGVDINGNLYYSEEFTMKLTSDEVKFVICHEALHVAFGHVAATGSRNRMLCNIAQDVIVNMLVRRAGVGSQPDGTIPYDQYNDSCTLDFGKHMPDGHVQKGQQQQSKQQNQKQNKQLVTKSYTVERVSEKNWQEVYAELLKFLKDNNMTTPQQQPNGKRSMGFDNHFENGESPADQEDGNGKKSKMSPQEVKEKRDKWKQRLSDAAMHAKQQGRLPNGMERFVEELLEPKVQWRTMLLKYLRPHTQPVDWTYQRPNRKSKVLGVYLPTTLKEGVEVEVIVDTSGSIGKQELTEFLSEISGINKAMQHVSIGVTFWDAADHGARYELNNANEQDILDMQPKGGGGTDMEAALDWIVEKKLNPPVAIVLTDGFTNFTANKYLPFDVVWVLTEQSVDEDRIPYGKVVKMQ